jgi:predicted regulator of Ras-like GTPase activity (Roadblock/LC7/MglB family)
MSQELSGLEGRLLRILGDFTRDVDGVRGAAVADRQGLPMANGFHGAIDLMAVTAMSALAMDSSRKIFAHFGVKGFQSAILEGEDARIVAFDLGGGEASFITVAGGTTNLGILKFRMALAARLLEEELNLRARTGPNIEEIFLLTKAGLLIAHVSQSSLFSKDMDIMAGMVAAVQAFVRDSFGDRGGVLEEMGMGNAVLRLVAGRWCTLALITSGPLRPAYLSAATRLIARFEEENPEALNPWDGLPRSLAGVDEFTRELLDLGPG